MFRYPFVLSLFFCLFGGPLFFTPSPAQAQHSPANTNTSPQVIRLKDGTLLKGQLVSIDGEIYTIRTPRLGEINVRAADVESIAQTETAAQPPAALGNVPTPGTPSAPSLPLNSFQEKMMNDPEVRACIDDIVADKEIMSLLENKDILGTILQQDPKAVLGNEKIQALLQHPKMIKLMSLLMTKMQGSIPGR